MKKTLLTSVILILICLTISGCQIHQANVSARNTEEQILNLYGIDPYTLDPAISGEATSHGYIMQIFSGLVRLDEDLEPVPDIAKRWEISSNGQRYTFYLRDDVQFHDGTFVTAHDFKYSWERTCNPNTGSTTASTYLGDIVGIDKVLAGETNEIDGVKVINEYVLQVDIDAPKVYFLSKLSYPTAFVVDKDNVESDINWWREPNGTGPFKFKEWVTNSRFVLERNDGYYREPAIIDRVVFHLWAGAPMDLYERDQIDVASVHPVYIDRVTDPDGSFLQELAIFPELSFSYIGFNHAEPPFDDLNVRRAFSQAVNKDKIIRLVTHGTQQRADGILPPGMPGFNEDLDVPGYNMELAQEFLAESYYGDSSDLPPIIITTVGWGGLITQELEAIIYEWQTSLGVDVNVRQLEPERFLYYLKQERDEMFFMGWIADYPHPQDFLEILFHSLAEQNYGEYENHEVDTLLELASVQSSREQSMELYQTVEQILVDDIACIPLSFGQNYVLIKPYVKGFTLNALGIPMLDRVTIASH
jgi:oligopeptide transport system substrate-binding protein